MPRPLDAGIFTAGREREPPLNCTAGRCRPAIESAFERTVPRPRQLRRIIREIDEKHFADRASIRRGNMPLKRQSMPLPHTIGP